ncbi:hypothetical protein RND81_01G111500 [Saponaria officinalis]|uniref:Glutamate receptor n=1 Tax=Saponaria officinalis TaxID=3572 RepID=A0AAW1NEM2_SAPOF
MRVSCWSLLSFVFIVCLLLNGARTSASRPAVVHVGALFTFNSTIGKVAKIAIQEAVNDVNSNPSILQGTMLNLEMRDSICNGFSGFIQSMQFMEKEVVAVIGPQSSVVAHMVGTVVSELQIPLLSFAATDPTLTPLEYPYFVRTANSDAYQMSAISDVVEYYGWKQVIAIYNDDDHGRNSVASLDDALANNRCRISYKAAIPPEGVTRSEVMDVLVKVSTLESRVIVLDVTPDAGRLIFSVAEYMQMTGSEYVWISTDWLSSVLDSYSPLPSDYMSSIQGVLVLRSHLTNSDKKRAFTTRWKNSAVSSVGLNAYGFYAYDSVWILAHAIDAFLNKGGNVSFSSDPKLRSLNGSQLHFEALRVFDGGQALMSHILQSNFTGLTGPVSFDADRSRVHPAFDIINVIGNGYRTVGYWSNGTGLSVRPPETLYNRPSFNRSNANQNMQPVIWPDGSAKTPRGWVFPNSGKQLQIGVPIRVSFTEFISRVPGSNDTFHGFCVDVFQAAVNLLPYPVLYQFVGFGDGRKNPNYTDLVKMIAAGNIDAAIGDIAIITSRTKFADFTQPFTSSGLVVVAPFKALSSGGWAFLRPFSLLLWAVIVISFISIGVVVWTLEHGSNDEFRGSPMRQFITILWFSFSTLTFSHKENTVSCPGKMVVIVWLFVVLILTSSYTASLTSILTVEKLSSSIKGIGFLKAGNQRIGYQVGSYASKYLTEELGITPSRLVQLDSPEAYAHALRSGLVDALVDELPYVKLFLSSVSGFRIIGPEFTASGWGFAFPENSPLAPDMSTAILKLSDNGDLQRIHDKWLTPSGCSEDSTQIESSQLQLSSFVGLFVLCGFVCVIALAVYFTRICRKLRHASRTEVVPNLAGCKPNLKRVRTLVSLIDERYDPSKKKRKRRRDIEDSTSDDDDRDEKSEQTRGAHYVASSDSL